MPRGRDSAEEKQRWEEMQGGHWAGLCCCSGEKAPGRITLRHTFTYAHTSTTHSQTHTHTCTCTLHPDSHHTRTHSHTHTHKQNPHSQLTLTHILLPTHAHSSHIHITHVCTHTHTCTHNCSQSSCSYLWSPAFPSCSARSSQASSDNLPLTLCRKTPSCACHSPMSSAIWL